MSGHADRALHKGIGHRVECVTKILAIQLVGSLARSWVEKLSIRCCGMASHAAMSNASLWCVELSQIAGSIVYDADRTCVVSGCQNFHMHCPELATVNPVRVSARGHSCC